MGDIQVKEVETPSGKHRILPEFESVKAIAALSGKSVLELMDTVKKELNDPE